MVRYENLVGVGDHIKVRRGRHGNTGEPTVSTRNKADHGPLLEQGTGSHRKLAAPG